LNFPALFTTLPPEVTRARRYFLTILIVKALKLEVLVLLRKYKEWQSRGQALHFTGQGNNGSNGPELLTLI
jgi:hypothetical protein